MMVWEKKGLIFTPDNFCDDMISHAAIPFAEEFEKKYLKIYFSSRNKLGQSLPYIIIVEKDNISNIVDINSKPLLNLGPLGSFDDSGIMPSWVIKYNNKRYMYYIAWNPQVTVSYRLSIGLAISDLKSDNFIKYSIAPICDRSLEEPYFNTAPCVLNINGLWKMWYISCTGWEVVNNYPEPKYHVKYAESKDGIHWVKTGIICIDYDVEAEAIGRPSVLFEDNKFKMWYSYRKITNYREDKNNSYQIGYAESNDGINWQKKYNLIDLKKSDSGWDSEMVTYSHILKIENKLIMFYNGNGFGKTGFGYAECYLDE